jgi:hypothetical protein
MALAVGSDWAAVHEAAGDISSQHWLRARHRLGMAISMTTDWAADISGGVSLATLQVRRRADGAKGLVREWIANWRDSPLVTTSASHRELTGAAFCPLLPLLLAYNGGAGSSTCRRLQMVGT